MKLPLLTSKELLKILRKVGFIELRQKGSHKFLKHPDGRSTVVPVHKGRKIGKGLLRKIINETEMEKERFLKLIRKK